MKIAVKMLGSIKKYGEGKLPKGGTLEIKKNATLEELLKFIDIPPDESRVVLVNRVEKNKEYLLKEGDEVIIFSLNCGG